MAAQTMAKVNTAVDHVHCASCRATVPIFEILDAVADNVIEIDTCPRCSGMLFPIIYPRPA